MDAEDNKPNWSGLGLRVATGLPLIIAIILVITMAPLAWLGVVVAIVAGLAMWEQMRMVSPGKWGVLEITSLVAAVLLPVCAVLGGAGLAAGFAAGFLAIAIAAILSIQDLDMAWERMPRLGWAAVYCGGLLATLLVIGAMENGRALIMFSIICVAAADVGAYFAGHQFGRHKLAPRLSPGKTIEGLGGGLLLAAIVGAVFVSIWVPDTVWWLGAVLGAVLGGASVLGDLLESSMKRQAGVKDSGGILPGHGGILDRVDGHLVAFPLFLLIRVIWW